MKQEDKAFQAILRGVEPEKKIIIPVGSMEPAGKEEAKTRKDKIADIMQKARRPWWCPECGDMPF